jgi:biotin carboxylase
MKSSKYIMVLPGTVWQIPLIKHIKNMGYKTVVVHPYKDAPAFTFADEIELSDILDKDACLEIAKKWEVCAVMSDECDIATPTLAFISQQLGLPSQGNDMAKLYTNKYMMREVCKKYNLPCPEYKLCYTLEDALDFFASYGKKMIMKPIDANSSRGVFTIESKEDLIRLFSESIKHAHNVKAVICEGFISGAEFSVDGIMMPGGHKSLVVSEKTQFSYNKNLDNMLYFSHYNEKYDYDLLRKINDEFVMNSGLPFGFTHAEYRYDNGNFYLLEIGARGGGNLISSHILPAMTGIDNYSILVDQFVNGTTTRTIDFESIDKDKVAILSFFDTTEEGGIVENIEGIEFLKNNSDIIYYQFNFKVGDFIKRPTDGGNRIGFYIACCDNKMKMSELISDIENKVKIIYKK